MSPHNENGLLVTPLHEFHLSWGARLVPFGGWHMPLQYAGILSETKSVRSNHGVFDVSHMGRLLFNGPGSQQFLEKLLTPNISTLAPGRVRYGFLLKDDGGIIDDILVSRLGLDGNGSPKLLVVCNASTRVTVIEWFNTWMASFPEINMLDITFNTAMIAAQGPMAASAIDKVFNLQASNQRPFGIAEYQISTNSAEKPVAMLISRTGYTGEDGFEIICPFQDGVSVWHALVNHGAIPCGLGARDSLRLEAGLMLSGIDIDQSTTPLEAQLHRFINMEKEFVGKQALVRQQSEGLNRKLVGFRLLDKRIARHGYSIYSGNNKVGIVTSGGFSPTLDTSIGLGYVSIKHSNIGTPLSVDIRGRSVTAEVIKTPFYRRN